MISEIKGKISSTGSNLSDRLEDKLTGDFFGALRYLPFEQGLKGILEQVKFDKPNQKTAWNTLLNQHLGFELEYNFWPQHSKGEIDLLLKFEDTLVGIEVKYKSGISSQDEGEIVRYDESFHQLSRYSHMLEDIANGRKAYLIFLAPFSIQHIVQQQLEVKYNVSSSVEIGFVNWEDIHTKLGLMRKSVLVKPQEYILIDTEALLEVKGLKRFMGFENFIDKKPVKYEPYIYENLKIPSKLLWTWSELPVEKESEAYVYNRN